MKEATRKVGWRNGAILAVMLGSACWCAGWDIQRRFISPGAIAATRRFVATDQMLADAGRAGAVGLQFIHCDGGTRQFAYFRAVYDLYPRPVVIVNHDDVVFNARQIPDGVAHSADWWARRGVKTVVSVDQARNSWEAESVPATNPAGPG